MIVAELLSREHALFRALLDRLELDLAERGESARRDVAQALAALLPAIDQHEAIEDITFRHPPDGINGQPDSLAEITVQHREISAVRDQILAVLERAAEPCSIVAISELVVSLIRKLRVHLVTEERRLWPLYTSALARPVEAVFPIHLGKRALALETLLDHGIAAISHGDLARPP